MTTTWNSEKAVAYDHSYADLCAGVIPTILPHLQPTTVLDVGCGAGRFTLAAAKAGFQVEACDYEPEMAALTAQALEADEPFHGVQICVDRLPELAYFPEAHFDNAVTTFVLNHVPNPLTSLRGLARVVRPGGRIISAVWSDQPSPHPSLMKSLLQQHGQSQPQSPSQPRQPQSSALPEENFARTPDGFAQLHEEAGLEVLTSEPISWIWETSWDKYWLGMTAGIGSTGEAFAAQTPQTQALIESQLRQQFAEFKQAEGDYHLPCHALLCVAVRPE